MGVHLNTSCGSEQTCKTWDADYAKKGEVLRINSILLSDDLALEEAGLIGADSHQFA